MWPWACPAAPEAYTPVIHRLMGQVVSPWGPGWHVHFRRLKIPLRKETGLGVGKQVVKERARAPGPQGTPELSVGNDTAGTREGPYGRTACLWVGGTMSP